MSAWRVSQKHIDALVNAAIRVSMIRSGDLRHAQEIGTMLWEENYKSVNARYGEDVRPPKYIMEHISAMHMAAKPLVVLKAIASYEYQSCEHDGWIDSDAREFCHNLRARLMRFVPGYDDADGWRL